jgi:hypothetical protein
MSKSITMLGACLALIALPALAGDAGKEIGIAAAHAGMAAGAQDPQMVRAHLHHVLNCLEGPNGADFAAAAGNPCKEMGAGAIADSATDARAPLEKAVALAKEGLAESDTNKAKVLASQAQAILSK